MYKGGRRLFRSPFLFNFKFKKMAVIKLGSIVTDIAGSIGGTTFRRTSTGHAVYNKQGRQVKSAFAKASRKNELGNIFADWYNLSEEERAQWEKNASVYPLKDKFGNTKYLTGRQLYTKLNAQLLPSGTTSNPIDFDVYVELAPTNINRFKISESELSIYVGGSFSVQTIYISMYQLRKKGRVKPHAHFKKTAVKVTSSDSVLDIWNEFREQFPLAVDEQTFGFNIQFVNSSGVMTSVLAFTAVAGSV